MHKRNYSRGKKSYSARPSNSRPQFRPRGNNNQKRRGPKKQYIDPDRFINHRIVEARAEEYIPKHAFSDFGLANQLLRNVSAIGYKTPSAIQDQTIPLAMKGQDVVGLANTGTGKTAAFLLPILNELFANRQTNSVLIMAPTRELAQQIDGEFRRFTEGLRLYSAVCVGGTSIGRQVRDLQRRPHVVIGTPGRLKDLINRGQLRLDSITTLVLDEADRMLDMGFIHDIREIASNMSSARQTLCFSATITPAVNSIIQDFLNHPVMISVKTTETNDHIYQDIVKFNSPDHRKELLASMLTNDEFEKVIVFGETKYGVQRLADTLTRQGIPSVAIHGNKSQSQRERALRQFKGQEVKVLVATDVAARGLDIPGVSHVINYDTPASYDDYVHRIGRTGRAGKTGKALTFVSGN